MLLSTGSRDLRSVRARRASLYTARQVPNAVREEQDGQRRGRARREAAQGPPGVPGDDERLEAGASHHEVVRRGRGKLHQMPGRRLAVKLVCVSSKHEAGSHAGWKEKAKRMETDLIVALVSYIFYVASLHLYRHQHDPRASWKSSTLLETRAADPLALASKRLNSRDAQLSSFSKVIAIQVSIYPFPDETDYGRSTT